MLAPCIDCRRHVRIEDGQCPFCGGAVSAPPPQRAVVRSRRAAIIFASTIGIAGCGSDGDDYGVVALYGAPADSALFDTGAKDTTVTDTGADSNAPDTTVVSDSSSTDAADAADTADVEETRILPPYGAPSPDVVLV